MMPGERPGAGDRARNFPEVHYMKRFAVPLIALAMLASASSAQAAVVGYTLDITTFYQFGPVPADFAGGGNPTPDTGFWRLTNSGTTTFMGTMSDVAERGFPIFGSSGNDGFSVALTLLPGQSKSIAIGDEASNVGGYNGPYNNGTPQPGVLMQIN